MWRSTTNRPTPFLATQPPPPSPVAPLRFAPNAPSQRPSHPPCRRRHKGPRGRSGGCRLKDAVSRLQVGRLWFGAAFKCVPLLFLWSSWVPLGSRTTFKGGVQLWCSTLLFNCGVPLVFLWLRLFSLVVFWCCFGGPCLPFMFLCFNQVINSTCQLFGRCSYVRGAQKAAGPAVHAGHLARRLFLASGPTAANGRSAKRID